MPKRRKARRPSALPAVIHNVVTDFRNRLAELPGVRPRHLVVPLSGSYPTFAPQRGPMELPLRLKPREATLEELERLAERLADAPWLETVTFRFEANLALGTGAAHALRAVVARLRAAGKRTRSYAPSLSLGGLYLASGTDEIVMPPAGALDVLGLAVGAVYLRDALERIGVAVEKFAIREYKSAGDSLARSSMSDGDREQLGALLDDLETELYGSIAAGRGVPLSTVRGWIDEGITHPARALEVGMIDRVAFDDDVIDDDARLAHDARRMLKRRRRPRRGGAVSIVELEGAITTGASRRNPLPFAGGVTAGSDTVVAALRSAARNPATEAIVLHVDSPGGSPLASDLVSHEIERIVRHKPVVVAMGRVAASGGYYVATHATRIVAAPLTITGSIGVVATQVVLEEFNRRYGLNPQYLQRGRYARLLASDRTPDDEERALVERFIRETYDRFVERVATGRGMTPQRVDELGRGRIWTGRAALERGLVDSLGGVRDAVSLARDLAGLPDGVPARRLKPPQGVVLPRSLGAEAALEALLEATLDGLAPWQRERALVLLDPVVRLRL